MTASITPRRMDFEFPEDIPDAWADGNEFLSALLAGLSASFPAGERLFIDSVRHYAGQVEDPELRARVRGFIGQEANHTKEHLAFNRFLEERGFGVLAIEAAVEQRVKALRKRTTPAQNLAHTAALEHLTAYIASAVIEDEEFLSRSHPTIAALWKWHAIEEIEHRAVAFDVYEAFVGDEALRVRSMLVTSAIFSGLTLFRTALIMKRTGHLANARAWLEGLDTLFGRRGVFRKTLPLYLAYYQRGFHPDQHDNEAALARAKDKYLRTAHAA